jgi:hypothetical protein
MSDELKGVILIIVAGAMGWLWNELQKLMKANDVLVVRIEHLEADNSKHKDNHVQVMDRIFEMVTELKQDISDLKETVNRQNPRI